MKPPLMTSIAFRPMRIVLLALIPVTTVFAEPRFAITKSTMDAGGNRSADTGTIQQPLPRFTLAGTIGQPDAAPTLTSASSRFAIQPGFWNGYNVVQIPGAPQLSIREGASGFVVLAWPVSVEGFMLEQSPDLSPQSWTDVLTPVVDTATEHTVTVPITGPRMFFRLKKP